MDVRWLDAVDVHELWPHLTGQPQPIAAWCDLAAFACGLSPNLRTRIMSNNRFDRSMDWRALERCFIDYLRSEHVPLTDGGGTAFVEIVLGVDETLWLSVEGLARHLAEELER
jgi:hypothetical protein